MPMFMCLLNWTEQGIRSIKEAPKRAKAAQELAKKVGVEIKEVYLTSGDSDLLVILDTPNGDNVAKFALAIGSLGNVRTRTVRAWPESEFLKLTRHRSDISACRISAVNGSARLFDHLVGAGEQLGAQIRGQDRVSTSIIAFGY